MIWKNRYFILLPLAVIGALSVMVNNMVTTGAFSLSFRKLRNDGQPMQPIDTRKMCSGPRRDFKSESIPLYKHSNAQYGLHIGHTAAYGKTNNQIISLFNTIDMAMSSGKWTVVVVSGWAEDLLATFFPDDESWETLSRDLPIVRNSTSHGLMPIMHTADKIFLRNEQGLKEQNDWDITQSRRLAYLHYLFSSLSLDDDSCRFLSKIHHHLYETFGATEYIAVHVRHMEGKCLKFNFDHVEQCDMNSTFIKSIVEPTGLYGKLPIVLLSDMQDKEKLLRIQREVAKVVIPEFDLKIYPSVLSDLVVGASSEYFIGVRASSMSRNIGLLREAFGKNISTNYINIHQSKDGKWTNSPFHHPYSWVWGED